MTLKSLKGSALCRASLASYALLTAVLGLSSLALSRVDSIMLVEEGFSVTSVDASDKMLKYALKERWNRRQEPAFDKWVIEEANWMTLDKDVPRPAGGGFDAVICLGNSFAHLPDCKGDQSEHRQALKNIVSMVRSGGLLVIDHRNYDHILSTGCAPPGKNIYYKVWSTGEGQAPSGRCEPGVL